MYSSEIAKTEIPTFAELYEVKTQSTTYRYTSFAKDVFWSGYLYLARGISRGEFSFSDRLRAMRVKISVPLLPAILQYIATAPPQATSIKIIRKFIENNDAIQLFFGYIVNITIEKNIASVDCESETRLLRNKVPRYVFQAYCNHQLFDSVCGLVAENYKTVATISGINESQITSAVFATKPDQYFQLGYISFGEDLRLVTNHIGNAITLQMPFIGLEAGMSVNAFPGCDKSYDTCLNKFANTNNRLGFDHIPSSNPCIFGFQQ